MSPFYWYKEFVTVEGSDKKSVIIPSVKKKRGFMDRYSAYLGKPG